MSIPAIRAGIHAGSTPEEIAKATAKGMLPRGYKIPYCMQQGWKKVEWPK